MVYHKFELDHVNIKLLYETSEIPVRLSSTGKLSLESDFYKKKIFESVWDSIGFCIFSSNRDVDKFLKLNLSLNSQFYLYSISVSNFWSIFISEISTPSLLELADSELSYR
jgi:hypothetical protein